MKAKKVRMSDFSFCYKIMTYLSFIFAVTGVALIIIKRNIMIRIPGIIWTPVVLISISVALLLLIMIYALRKCYENE